MQYADFCIGSFVGPWIGWGSSKLLNRPLQPKTSKNRRCRCVAIWLWAMQIDVFVTICILQLEPLQTSSGKNPGLYPRQSLVRFKAHQLNCLSMSHPVKNYATKPPKHDLVSSRTAMQKALPHHLNNLCVTKTEFSDFLVYCVENNRNKILLFDLIGLKIYLFAWRIGLHGKLDLG